MDQLRVRNDDKTKKELFNAIINKHFGGRLDTETIHQAYRLVSMSTELSDIVAIDTSPYKSTIPLVEHIIGRFKEYGVNDDQITTHDYTQNLDGKIVQQQNFFMTFEPEIKSDNIETIVESFHLDTVAHGLGFSTSEEGVELNKDKLPKPFYLRTELRDKTTEAVRQDNKPDGEILGYETKEHELRLYGHGTNDMGNIAAVILQMFKERTYLSDINQFFKDNKWLKESIGQRNWNKYVNEIKQQKHFQDFLKNTKNRFIFSGTAGEELAGHQGLKELLKDYPNLKSADFWVIAEPSNGFSSEHKGYAAVKVGIKEGSNINGIEYNNLEQSLRLIDETRLRHSKQQLVEPHLINDPFLGLPTLNVSPLLGQSALSPGKNYLQLDFGGIAAHSSVPEEGENAIFYAAKFYSYLKKTLKDNISLVSIKGGDKRNQVPKDCSLLLEVNNESYTSIIEKINTITDLISDKYPRSVRPITTDKINLETGKEPFVTFDIEYRVVPGQDPENLKKAIDNLVLDLGINSDIRLIRDSYALDSRSDRLTDETQKLLLSISSQTKSIPAPFSTEGGTIANLSSSTIPSLVSSTHIDRAHQEDKEYISIPEFINQFGMHSNLLNYVLRNHVKGEKQIDVVSQIEKLADDIGTTKEELLVHQEWFAEHQARKGIFGVLRINKSQKLDLSNLSGVLNIFSDKMGLYPLVLTDYHPDELSSLLNNSNHGFIAAEGKDNFANRILTMIKSQNIPIMYGDIDRNGFCSDLVMTIDPLKYLLLTNAGGLLDSQGVVIPTLHLNEKIIDTTMPVGDIMGMVSNLKDISINGASHELLFNVYNLISKINSSASITDKGKKFRSVQVVSPQNMMLELFTTQGEGTLVRKGYDITPIPEKPGVIIYQEKDGIGRANIETFTNYAIVTHLDIDQAFIRQGFPETLATLVAKHHNIFAWTTLKGSAKDQLSPRLINHLRSKDYHTEQRSGVNPKGESTNTYIVGLNPYSRIHSAIGAEIMRYTNYERSLMARR